MANDITGRVWSLDTPGVVYKDAEKISFFEFDGYSVATDTVVIKDRNGRVIWSGRGATDFSVVRSGRVGWQDGLTFDSITPGSTGVVRVYIE